MNTGIYKEETENTLIIRIIETKFLAYFSPRTRLKVQSKSLKRNAFQRKFTAHEKNLPDYINFLNKDSP